LGPSCILCCNESVEVIFFDPNVISLVFCSGCAKICIELSKRFSNKGIVVSLDLSLSISHSLNLCIDFLVSVVIFVCVVCTPACSVSVATLLCVAIVMVIVVFFFDLGVVSVMALMLSMV
jgi:hypothetical protein